jgi:hypothetical protein
LLTLGINVESRSLLGVDEEEELEEQEEEERRLTNVLLIFGESGLTNRQWPHSLYLQSPKEVNLADSEGGGEATSRTQSG